MITLGFIGTGHMGASLATVIGTNPDYQLLLNNRTPEKAELLAKQIGSNARIASIEQIANNSDYIFLGVKPIDMDALLTKLQALKPKGVLVSMAAGVLMEELVTAVPNNPWIRIMPNTPVLIGMGLTLVIYHDVPFAKQEEFAKIMALTGQMHEIDEKQMNAISTLTGSAPAYLDIFLDALASAGPKLGLTKEEAESYVLAMAQGTVELALATKKSPRKLGEEVCSPGGSTIEGVNVMEKDGIYPMMEKAAEATFIKNSKMK